jgi:hypothetical protein
MAMLVTETVERRYRNLLAEIGAAVPMVAPEMKAHGPRERGEPAAERHSVVRTGRHSWRRRGATGEFPQWSRLARKQQARRRTLGGKRAVAEGFQ